jgi:hypothetical protein
MSEQSLLQIRLLVGRFENIAVFPIGDFNFLCSVLSYLLRSFPSSLVQISELRVAEIYNMVNQLLFGSEHTFSNVYTSCSRVDAMTRTRTRKAPKSVVLRQ